jgi:hypothetical protein
LKKVTQTSFENDLIDNTSLNRKAVSNILKIWNYRGSYDLEELQKSYLEYCRNSNYAEDRIKRIFEKLQVFFGLSANDGKFKNIPKSDEEDEALKNKELAAMWCKDKEMRDGLNVIIDLFQGNNDSDKDINLQEFLEFVKNPPLFDEAHICLTAMKIDILFEKAIENLKKDFNVAIAEELLEAGERDDYLTDPIR